MLRGFRSCSRGVVGFAAAFRTFSSSSVLFEKIDLTPFTKDKGGLEPTSKWHLEQLKQFCDLGFKSGLGFTKQQLEAVPLQHAEKAFAASPAGKNDITRDNWPFDLRGVPEKMHGLVEEKVSAAFVQLQAAIEQHVEGTKQTKTEKNIDTLALRLAILCGFDDGKQFRICGETIAFKFAGKKINSEADVYVAKRTGDSDQLVLIWEDKLCGETTSINQRLLHDSAAQIVGEMLSVHWKNRSHKHEPLEVYAIRLIDDMVAFFRMEMSAEQIKAVCDDGVVPNPKLQVDYVPMDALDAGDEYGVSLLHPVGRDWFVRMMACIRAEILKRELPEPVHFKSQKAGKAANPSNL